MIRKSNNKLGKMCSSFDINITIKMSQLVNSKRYWKNS